MSNVEPRGYQPPSVEDGDDDVQSRTTANVAVKRDLTSETDIPTPLVFYKCDDNDSGYASRAPTVSTNSSISSAQRRRGSDLKVDTTMVNERERKPYAITATPRELQPKTSSRPLKEKETKEAPKPVKKPFCHKEGICWVCDKYGFHFDPKDPPKNLLQKEQAKPATPAPQIIQQKPKPIQPRVKTEEFTRPTSRRMSSSQTQRYSMHAPPTPVQAPYAQYPTVQHGWPTMTPQPHAVQYTAYPFVPPSTPVAYMAPPPPQQQFYYDPNPFFEDFAPQQSKISRRLSTVVQDRPVLEKRLSRTSTVTERPVSRDTRPQIIRRPSKSGDADRLAMPPPPKPQQATTINTARPRPGRSNTYHSNVTSSDRRSYHEESSDEDDDEYVDPRMLVTYREPSPSPRRPPSSYKAPQAPQEIADRPQLAPKSQSYNEQGRVTQIAAMPRRRTTDSTPASAIERKEADAEAYMRKRGSMPLVELTADNLKTLKNAVPRHVSDQRSDSGSTASHVTHQSSSKNSSSGRGRALTSNASALGHLKGTSMNINIAGLNLNITDDGNAHEGPPVKLDVAGISISMGNRDKENIDYRKPGQKALEQGPGMSSKLSRRSLTSASLVSAATSNQRREREEILAIEFADPQQRELSRRDSYYEDEDREALERDILRRVSAKSSRQASRNTSSVRQPSGEDVPARPKIRSHRTSVDYSRGDEGFI